MGSTRMNVIDSVSVAHGSEQSAAGDQRMMRVRRSHALAGAIAGVFALWSRRSSAWSSRGADVRLPPVRQDPQNLDSLVWTGTQFLYVQNTANTVWAAPPAGLPLRQFATMPQARGGDPLRPSRPVGRASRPARSSATRRTTRFMKSARTARASRCSRRFPRPTRPRRTEHSAFDSVGHFGYRLLAATGRSGAAKPAGGFVYTIDRSRQRAAARHLRRAGRRGPARDRAASIRFGRWGRAPHGRRGRERRRRRRDRPERQEANDRDPSPTVRTRSP